MPRTRWIAACLTALAAVLLLSPTARATTISGVVYNASTGHWYKLYTTPTSFAAAKSAAEGLNGYLACVTSSSENSWIVSNVSFNTTPFLGATDEVVEGTWVWVSGETWNFTSWNAGEPNNSGNEDHLTLRPDGLWNDIPGTSNSPYVVEWNADPNGPPEAPAGLAAVAVSEQRVNLTWSDVSTRETSHELERATGAGAFGSLATLGQDVTSYADLTVAAETSYSYRARGIGSGGASDWSNTATVVTPPPTVTGLTGAALSNSRIGLEWTDTASTETGIEVERTTAGQGWARVGLLAANTTTFTDTGLAQETTYSYRVRVAGPGGVSAYCDAISVTTPPTSPNGLAVTTASDTQIVLGWYDASASETAFEIWRGDGWPATNFVLLATVGANVLAYTDDTVLPERTYGYRVRAVNSNGASGFTFDIRVMTPPFAPTSAAAEVLSATRVRVTWADNTLRETHYEVMRAVAPDGTFEHLADAPVNATQFDDSTATQEAQYLYRVAAVNGNGHSGWSVAGEVGTPAIVAIRKVALTGVAFPAKAGKPPQLLVTGDFDVGGRGVALSAAATIRAGGQEIAVPSWQTKGRTLRYDAEGVRVQLQPASNGSSRVAFTLVLQGASVASMDPEAELHFEYENGGFLALGSVQLGHGLYQTSKRGSLVDPALHLVSLAAGLKPGTKDTLAIKAAFRGSETPDAAPEVLIRFGAFELRAPGDRFKRSGDRWIFSEKVLGSVRTVTLDYAKGTVSVALRGIELEDRPRGAVPVPVTVRFGDLWFEDTPAMASTGKSVKY